MNKQRYNRVASDNSQLQQFVNEVCEKLPEEGRSPIVYEVNTTMEELPSELIAKLKGGDIISMTSGAGDYDSYECAYTDKSDCVLVQVYNDAVYVYTYAYNGETNVWEYAFFNEYSLTNVTVIHTFDEGTVLTEEIAAKIKTGDIVKVNQMSFIVANHPQMTPRTIMGHFIISITTSSITVATLDWSVGNALEPIQTTLSIPQPATTPVEPAPGHAEGE